METKKPWQSKTLLVGLLAAIAPFFPVVDVWIHENAALYASLLSGVFMVLRLVTKGKVSIE